tara:strand:+ start:206 stop:598 length:393 start_codon:yes stop_codon:yes gene_type:complete
MEITETPNHDALDIVCEGSGVTDCLVMREYDSALIGFYWDYDKENNKEFIRAVYNREEIIRCIVENSDFMSELDAIEYFEFNIARSLPHFPGTPLVVDSLEVLDGTPAVIHGSASDLLEPTKGPHPCDPS